MRRIHGRLSAGRAGFSQTSPAVRAIYCMHAAELRRYGALARVGKQIVILGKGYSRWLEHQQTAVAAHIPNTTRPDMPKNAAGDVRLDVKGGTSLQTGVTERLSRTNDDYLTRAIEVSHSG